MRRIIGQCSHSDLKKISNLILSEWDKPEKQGQDLNPDDYNFTKKEGIAWKVIVHLAKENGIKAIHNIKEVLVWENDNGTNDFEYRLINTADKETRAILERICR